jgi:pimeloyl-ACP methyl ester carboxylesterase
MTDATRYWLTNTGISAARLEVDKGGHFAAWEQPELFSSEMRAAFTSLV